MRSFLLALCILFSATISRSQSIIYFTPNGTGNMNGTSWANAKPGSELAPTMKLYFSYIELWVATGTYTTNTTVRDSSFFINSSLRVYGGFNGTETSITQRDIAASPTILSGDIGVQGDSTDNSYHVVQFRNADSTTVLDGFIIERGNADVNGDWKNLGGGIYSTAFGTLGVHYGSPRVRNCTIRNNHATHGGGGIADYTSGVWVGMGVDNCIFEYNTSGMGVGGAGFLSFSFAGDGPVAPVITNCIFRYNKALSGAGAIYQLADFDNSGTIHIKNCTFENNSAINVGAVAIASYVDLFNPNSHTAKMKGYIDSCTFRHNTSTIGGGAIIGATYNRGDINGHELHITNCVIDSNTSHGAPLGIRGYNTRTKNVIEHCTFSHNVTQSVGGVSVSSSQGNIDSTYVNNSLFHNTGKQGLYFSGARNGSFVRSFINNSTFYNDSTRYGSQSLVTNSAINDPGQGSGPCNAYMYINNSIVWHFSPGYMNAVVRALENFGSGSITTASIVTKNSVLNMDNNTWPNPTPGFGLPEYGTNGGGNIGVYPKFRDTANYDFRLGCGSLAIDAGSNALIPSGLTSDLDNHNRVLNNIVDMGCYEVDTLPTPLSSPTIALNNMDITCTAGFNMQPDSVLWTFGDGQTSNQLNPTHTYTADGGYEVCLRIYTACGTDEKCDTVTITGTSVHHLGNILQSVHVYPNPAKDLLTISGVEGTMHVKLITLTGSVLQETTLTQSQTQLDISNLAAGIYMIELASPSIGRRMIKVVKE